MRDRWLGGVAAGLGGYFDLSPTIYRIAFVALALAGGTGVLLYIAAWLVIPDEGAAESIGVGRAETAPRPAAARDRRSRSSRSQRSSPSSEADVWPSPGNLWLVVALAIAAFAWWRLGPEAPYVAAS